MTLTMIAYGLEWYRTLTLQVVLQAGSHVRTVHGSLVAIIGGSRASCQSRASIHPDQPTASEP